MKKLLEKANKNRLTCFLVYGTAIAVMGIILYPLLDYLFYTYITRSPFEYSVVAHIIEPIVFGYTVGVVYAFALVKK